MTRNDWRQDLRKQEADGVALEIATSGNARSWPSA